MKTEKNIKFEFNVVARPVRRNTMKGGFIGLMFLCLMANLAWSKGVNVSYDGQIDVQYLSLDNETDFLNTNRSTDSNDDYLNEIRDRIMLGLNFEFSENVMARVLLCKNNRLWGGVSTTNFGTENIGGILDQTGVYNAYLKVNKVLGWLDLSIGKQFYGEKGDLIVYVGPTENNNLSVYALDMLKCETSFLSGLINTEFIASKFREAGKSNSSLRQSTRDIDLLGVQVTAKQLIKDSKLNVFCYNYIQTLQNLDSQTNLVFLDTDNYIVYGSRIYFPIPFVNWLNVRAEFAINDGEQPKSNNIRKKYRGKAFIFGVDAKQEISSWGKLTLNIETAHGTGDNPDTQDTDEGFWSLNSDLRYGEIWYKTAPMTSGAGYGLGPEQLGTSEINNYKIYAFKSVFTPNIFSDNGSLSIDFYQYGLALAGAADNNTTVNIRENEPELGSEIDFGAKYLYSKDMEFKLVYAVFRPGKRYFLVNDINRFSVNLNIKF